MEFFKNETSHERGAEQSGSAEDDSKTKRRCLDALPAISGAKSSFVGGETGGGEGLEALLPEPWPGAAAVAFHKPLGVF